MAERKERYTLVIGSPSPELTKQLKRTCSIDCKTLREAKSWYDIQTESEKKRSYIWDNVRECKVEL